MNLSEKMPTRTGNRKCAITPVTSLGAIATLGILVVVLSGLLVTSLVGQFGAGFAIAVFLGVPLALFSLVLAIPQAARNAIIPAQQIECMHSWHSPMFF
jgi:hypothetical protein